MTETAPSVALRRRILTALLLLPVAVGGVLWLPTPAFAVLLGAAILFAAWEWCALANLDGVPRRSLYLAALLLGMAGLWWRADWLPWLFGLASLWWLIQLARLALTRRIEPAAASPRWQMLPSGLLVLALPWAALLHLHGRPDGPVLVLFLLLLIWTADSAAFFVGRRWGGGRARLAPVLSPGKTWVGVQGALAGAALCALAFGWMRSLDLVPMLGFLLLCGLTAAISVVGDLYESLLKRRRGVKDSGRLLPGHGGMLDRIDSLTAAAPVFALGIILMRI